jgi:hypothetical protein
VRLAARGEESRHDPSPAAAPGVPERTPPAPRLRSWWGTAQGCWPSATGPTRTGCQSASAC